MQPPEDGAPRNEGSRTVRSSEDGKGQALDQVLLYRPVTITTITRHSESTLQSFATFSQKPQTENRKLSDFCAFLCDHKMVFDIDSCVCDNLCDS